MVDYAKYSDEAIVDKIRRDNYGAMDYLINKYKKLVSIKTRAYYIIGADREDIVQEGMIGLYKAIRDYNPDRQASFFSFAELCISRQMISAIKSANRQKNIPLNSYISLNRSIFDEDAEKTYLDILEENRICNPEELYIGREEKKHMEKHIAATLSELECRVLSMYLQGKSYKDISRLMAKDEKAIDNALQRVRRKVEKILSRKHFVNSLSKCNSR